MINAYPDCFGRPERIGLCGITLQRRAQPQTCMLTELDQEPVFVAMQLQGRGELVPERLGMVEREQPRRSEDAGALFDRTN